MLLAPPSTPRFHVCYLKAEDALSAALRALTSRHTELKDGICSERWNRYPTEFEQSCCIGSNQFRGWKAAEIGLSFGRCIQEHGLYRLHKPPALAALGMA